MKKYIKIGIILFVSMIFIDLKTCDSINGLEDIHIDINDVKADGKSINIKNNKVVIPANTQNVSINIHCSSLEHQSLHVGYKLKGVDQKEIILENLNEVINYTNLKGGMYTYNYKVYDEKSNCLAQTKIMIQKKYKFYEEPKVRQFFYFSIIVILILMHSLILRKRGKPLKQEENEMTELLFKDLLTNVNNYNAFEYVKKNLKTEDIYAYLSVSINHFDYLKNKYGNVCLEKILKQAVKILQTNYQKDIEIYRVSENIFYLLVKKPIQIEDYLFEIKEMFKNTGENRQLPLSFAIGVVYNNKSNNIDEIFDQCEQMRLLDEKQAERDFIESKIKLL